MTASRQSFVQWPYTSNRVSFAAASGPVLSAQVPLCSHWWRWMRTGRLRWALQAGFMLFLLLFMFGGTIPSFAAPADATRPLAATPPMGWNDWAHYECNFNGQTILANAKALVSTGLSKSGYNTVTIDDCWMQKDRDSKGNLQADPHRFPQGMKPIADAVHALGLKFGIYEDAGYETCGGFAGSGEPNGGGKDHFLQDTRLFASWGVDYLKLDGCNLYVAKGSTKVATYRKAYAAQSAALKKVTRPIVFSESAPAYFQGTPDWYVVLKWVRDYGQLWREGTDIEVYDPKKPDASRFDSMMWNYAYNLPLGRFQKSGNWNDADFIIGGDSGITMAETRSQLALWSMMSAPLILSSDLEKLSPEAVTILSNKEVIAIDKDPLGRMATLVRRTSDMDILIKPLQGGDYAIAVSNRSDASVQVELRPIDVGFKENGACHLEAKDLWSGSQEKSASTLRANVASHDTTIWRVRPNPSCGVRRHTGTIIMVAGGRHHHIKHYSRCMSASGSVSPCSGALDQVWEVRSGGVLQSQGKCLDVVDTKPQMQTCSARDPEHWKYTLAGKLVGAGQQCLTANTPHDGASSLALLPCGDNRPDQIWSLPN